MPRFKKMTNPNHQWTIQHQGMLASDPVGPIPEAKLVRMAKAGEIKNNTLVVSPSRTKNKWVEAKSFAPLAKMIAEASQQVAVVEATVVQPSSPSTMPAVPATQSTQDDSQNAKMRERVTDFLMTGESIEYVCMQTKKMALKRDGIVITNMRFIMAKPKMLGRFEFIDCMWIDLHSAHVKEGMLGSTFQISSNETSYWMDHLSKKDARKVYQIAQDREQAVRWQRRSLEMEERAAGAMQVNIGQPIQEPAPVSEQRQPSEDPMEKLAKLKKMLEAGLIEQAEYDATKARILDSF